MYVLPYEHDNTFEKGKYHGGGTCAPSTDLVDRRDDTFTKYAVFKEPLSKTENISSYTRRVLKGTVLMGTGCTWSTPVFTVARTNESSHITQVFGVGVSSLFEPSNSWGSVQRTVSVDDSGSQRYPIHHRRHRARILAGFLSVIAIAYCRFEKRLWRRHFALWRRSAI